MMTKRLTSYCKEVLAQAYYSRVREGLGVAVSDAEAEERGWRDFGPWDGEDYMYTDPEGQLWLTNADEPCTAVNVTDVPLQYADSVSDVLLAQHPVSNPPTVDDFQQALGDDWAVEIQRTGRNWQVTATNRLFGTATIGPKLRLVPCDVGFLAMRVDDLMAPSLTYSQWLASGDRLGFSQTPAKMTPLTKALRLLAITLERGELEEIEVAQALFNHKGYTVDCPIAMASAYREDVAELSFLLGRVAKQYGYPWREDDDDDE